MYLGIVSKLAAEALLSFYSIFVKKINVPIILQIWSRFFTYVTISAFFIDWNFVSKNVLSINGILISFITMIHVYSSYRSFQLLESGVATTLFYVYPLMILLFSGAELSPVLLIALFGVYLLASEPSKESDEKKEPYENIIKENTTMKESFLGEGIFAVFIAALTEALLFFMVKNIKTMNNWNHLFLSYFFGSIALTAYLWSDVLKMELYSGLSLSLSVNAFIGLIGYYLRFFAISRLDAHIYAPLSYFGIVMSYIYGVFLNNDSINIRKIIGTLSIIFVNMYIFMTHKM
jgi:drug/metabolite transporter (DMT)-like permease